MQCFNEVLIRHIKASYILENSKFRGTQENGAKKVRNKSYSIGKGNIILEYLQLRKGAGHNSEPTKQSYYLGSGLLMDNPFEKLFGCNGLMVV